METLRVLDWQQGDHALKVDVVGYENPDCIDGDDANILVLGVHMRNREGAWKAAVPCIRTAELPLLRDWLRLLSTGVVRARPRYFLCLDLDLKFYHRGRRGGQQRVIVVLRFGLAQKIGERAVLSFLVEPSELGATVEKLDEAVTRFPFRSEATCA